MDVHPVVVLLALAFWYALWGVTGAHISVPPAVCLRGVSLGEWSPSFSSCVFAPSHIAAGTFARLGIRVRHDVQDQSWACYCGDSETAAGPTI